LRHFIRVLEIGNGISLFSVVKPLVSVSFLQDMSTAFPQVFMTNLRFITVFISFFLKKAPECFLY